MKRSKKAWLPAAAGLMLSGVLLTGSSVCAAEITVSASSTVRLAPDKATVSFGVTTQDSTADQAQEKNSEAVKDVMEMLTERGIEEKNIRTTNYSLYPQYDYSEKGEQTIVGYVVRTSMSVQDQDIEDIGKLLTDCVSAGINMIDNVSFLCSGYDEAYAKALTEAVEASRVKAEVLAKAAGKTLGEVVSITEGWQDTSIRYGKESGIYFEMAADVKASGPSFIPGESEITANVTASYQME